MKIKFRHLGVAVATLDPAIDMYFRLFDYKLFSGPYDDPIQKVSVCFLRGQSADDSEIELIAPLTEDSPLKSFLKRGGGAYHMCFEVPDLAATIPSMVSQGCRLLAEPSPAVAFSGRRIAWIHTPNLQLIELLERESNIKPAKN